MGSEAGGDARCGIGQRLRAARERSGLTLLQAAERLHVDAATLEALESERFETLGVPVFVRGHIRRYAELVGESPAELQELYATSKHIPPPPDLTRIARADRSFDPGRVVLPAAAMLIGLGIFSVVWFALEGTEGFETFEAVVADDISLVEIATSQATEATESNTPSPEVIPVMDKGADSNASGGAGNAGASGLTAAVLESSAATEEKRQAAESQQAADEAANVSTTLGLRFAAESWVEVYDAEGRQIFFGLGEPDTMRRITGAPPLRVLLGNAPGVSVEVDGQRKPLPQSVRRNRVAEFVIDRAGRVRPTRLASNGD